MDALLERTFDAEQRHFWFRGFKRFVAPVSLQKRPRARRIPGCWTPAAAPAPTFLSSSSTARRSAWSSTGEGCEFGHARGLPRLDAGQRHGSCHFRLIDGRRAVVRRALLPRTRRRKRRRLREMYRVLRPGGALIVNVAAMHMLKGDHSVLGGEVHRYRKRELRTSWSAPDFWCVASPTPTRSCFPSRRRCGAASDCAA